MALFKILNTTHLDYDPTKVKKMCLLYEGGYDIMKHANMFMTKLTIESQNSYNERLQCAAYLPYLSQFIDQFSSSLFADDLIAKEASDANDQSTLGGTVENEDFYKIFAADCDLQNDSFHNFMKDTFTEALYSPCAYLGIDFSNTKEEDQPINLLEEESRGLSRAYLYDIDPLSVIDWKCNEANQKYDWVKLRNLKIIQPDPLQPAMKQIEFKVWTMNGDVAHWALYQSKPIALNKEFRENDDVPLVDEGDTSFREIPVFALCIPCGLHLGEKLGPVCEEFFQRRSFLVSNMNKTCVSIPYIKLGPEISAPGEALPSDVQANPNRGNRLRMQLSDQGYTVVGKDDDVGIAEAHGYSHELADKQLTELREQMHQVVQQMAQAVTRNKQAMGRSGASKQEDRHATEILLTAYARVIKDFVKELYICISAARGESVVWAIQGLSTFVSEDRDTIIAEVTAVAGQQPILDMLPSETFHKKYLLRLAIALAGTVSPEEEATIQEELEDAIEKGQHTEMLPGHQDLASPQPGQPAAPSADPASQGDDQMAMGPAGQPLLPEGAHLQTGEHIDPQEVYDHLSQDYNDKDIQWVLHIPWVGPVEVPLNSIDFSNKDNWQAAQPEDQEHVDQFADKMANDNMTKPIVLVNAPAADSKMMIVDGHHRALGAQQNGTPVPAYVGQVGRLDGPWKKLHSKQVGKKEGSGLVASSQQVNDTSMQKQISTQVKKSEKAKGGKTK